jgi:hypothetical protein
VIGAAHQTNVCVVLVGKPDGRMPLAGPGHRWGRSYLRCVLRKSESEWVGFMWLR